MLLAQLPPNPNVPWLNPELTRAARRAAYRAYNDRLHSVHEPFLHDPNWRAAELSLLTTSGTIIRHCDSPELPPISYHAILVNDGFVAKGPEQRRGEIQEQKPGCIIALNIHEEHHLAIDARLGRCYNNQDYPTWASLCFNVDEPLPWEKVQARFLAALALNPELP